MCAALNDSESLNLGALSLVVIGPNEERRRTIAKALAGPHANVKLELPDYPQIDDLGRILEGDHDAVIIDLDPDPERALDVVENICGASASLTVMVHSARPDSDLLVRCMRAGAREFLVEPLVPGTVVEALVRASARRDEARRHKRATGKLLVFAGAKGGSGITTVASNFAVALAKQSGAKVALLDLEPRMGDAALTLGLIAKFSTLDAFENTGRLDSDFLAALFVRHDSGLSVLAGPDNIPESQPAKGAVERLLRLVREDFAYVVVDAGSRPNETTEALFELATSVYLVVQVGVTDLRNANRFVSRYFQDSAGAKLEIVLNRFQARNLEIDEAAITSALTRPAKWKIPNDFAAVRRALNTGIAITSEGNQISRALMEIVTAASGQAAVPRKKKRFGVFG